MASLPQNDDAFGCKEKEVKGRVMWKALGRGPEAKRLGVRSLVKKAKEAFEPRKGLNGFTGSREKPTRNKEKNTLQLTAIQERRNMSYNELGKDFSECVKGKKNIIHVYFMLSNKPVWERNRHIDFCILTGS